MASSGRARALAMLIAAAVAIVVIAAVVQVGAGSYEMTWRDALGALADGGVWGSPGTLLKLVFGEAFARSAGLNVAEEISTTSLIVWNVRLPRVLVALCVGINLSFSGCIFQAITRNEMASPYLLGVSSGAGLAILIVLVLAPALSPFLPVIAMFGGGVAFLVVYTIAWNRGTSPVRLVLAGIIVAAIAGSLQTAVFMLANDVNTVQSALAWTTGSLTGTGWPQVRMVFPWMVISVVLGFAASRHLDVILLGDATARALGMPIERTRFLLAATAILAAGSAVSVAGLIGFVGLIVPHVVRSIVGSRHTRLLTGCLFAGPALLVSADTFARLLVSPVQLPVGIVTGCLGGVFFLYLMRTKREIAKL